MAKLFIPVLVGTTREQRKSIMAARMVAAIGTQLDDVEVVLVDPKDFTFSGDGNDPEGKDSRYTDITRRADGFFIVTPEYNHSFPGSLKRMLDSELQNYIHKPVAFAGVSSGPWGGVRAIEALVGTVREMGLVATFTDVQFPKIGDMFDAQGGGLDTSATRHIEASWKELVWMAKTLAYGREHIPSKYHATE